MPLAGFLRCLNSFDRSEAVAVDLYQWNCAVTSDLRKYVNTQDTVTRATDKSVIVSAVVVTPGYLCEAGPFAGIMR